MKGKPIWTGALRLGMKVHYNLLSVSGGGGVSSKIEGLSE